jgi:16S rRNA processing protein RimM
MGHVSAPFGVQGWIKVHPYTETNTGLTGYTTWWLGKNGSYQAYEVLEARAQGTEVVAKLKGFEDREAALSLRGMEVAVPRNKLPKTRRDEYYWSDLIGLKVVNTEGLSLGTVKQMLATGANDVLVVGGERERLIPFVRQVIQDVDVQGGTIQVEWGADY